jgi:hypothetical protein
MKRQTIKCAALAARANAEFLVTLCAYALLTLVASRKWGIPIYIELYDEAFVLFGAAITISLLLYLIARMVLIDKPERPFEHLWHSKFCVDWEMPNRLSIGIPAALALPIFFSFFTSVKLSINKIIPFYADPLLANADRILMGNDAWRMLQPLVGLPAITFALSFIYNLWLIVTIATLFWVTFSVGDLRLRRQYLVAFVLVWAILGNLIAILVSSAGPCFYEFFYGLPRYADLMAYLNSANRDFPIWSLSSQIYLLKANNGPHLGAGISAFPSMHVAAVMLNVMLCRHLQRPWLIASVLFLILILIGSVQLGWHYVVDGYFSIIAVPVIWWVAGKFSLANIVKRVVPDNEPPIHEPLTA